MIGSYCPIKCLVKLFRGKKWKSKMAAIMSSSSRNSDPFARHRSQYKCTTPPWKDTYKKRCMERLRNGRQRFLDRFRQMDISTCDPEITTNVSSEVEKVMNEEWSRIAGENSNLPSWKPTKESCQPFPGVKLHSKEETELNEIISMMEEIQRELIEEEQLILRQYNENVRFEEESLCAAIDKLSTDDVLCPVCKRNPLHQNKQVIFCQCGMRIDTEYDALDLSYVKSQIEESIATHRDEGCNAEPEFVVSDNVGLGVSNLITQCQTCGFLYIVI